MKVPDDVLSNPGGWTTKTRAQRTWESHVTALGGTDLGKASVLDPQTMISYPSGVIRHHRFVQPSPS